jgi:hypothetical protein
MEGVVAKSSDASPTYLDLDGTEEIGRYAMATVQSTSSRLSPYKMQPSCPLPSTVQFLSSSYTKLQWVPSPCGSEISPTYSTAAAPRSCCPFRSSARLRYLSLAPPAAIARRRSPTSWRSCCLLRAHDGGHWLLRYELLVIQCPSDCHLNRKVTSLSFCP